MTETPRRDTALYRLFNADDQLLYVGITSEPATRFRQHRRDKPWWEQVATREIEWHGSRDAAERAELRAIKRELPRYNDMGVQWPLHLLGSAPARTLTMTQFRVEPIKVIDGVASSSQPVILTRKQIPLVVLVPYFDLVLKPSE